MAGKPLFFLLLILPLSAQSQVYHCDGPEGPVYSQIPCEANAERLVIYDPPVKPDDDSQHGSDQAEDIEAVEQPATPMESFVATLHSQRREQLEAIDEEIHRLKESLEAEGDQALKENERQSAFAKLSSLESDRSSIDEQYASLISEAERRAGSVQGIN